jgi:hypothetical protein
MSILRVACGQCGLAATLIQTGDRNTTSFDAEECAKRCAVGRAASAAGEPVASRVLECEHLGAALRAAVKLGVRAL